MESVVLSVRLDHDLEIGRGRQDSGVRQGHEPDLIQGVRRVGDQLSEENLKIVEFSFGGIAKTWSRAGDITRERGEDFSNNSISETGI